MPTSSSHATPQRLALVCQVLAARHRVAHPDTVALQRRHQPSSGLGLGLAFIPSSEMPNLVDLFAENGGHHVLCVACAPLIAHDVYVRPLDRTRVRTKGSDRAQAAWAL